MTLQYGTNGLAKEIVHLLYDYGMIKTWYKNRPEGWILGSGIWSPIYINLRPLGSTNETLEVLRKIGHAMGQIIKSEIPDANKVLGVYLAGHRLASAISLTSGIPFCLSRHRGKVKKHGEHHFVEGRIFNGDKLVIVDDLATKLKTVMDTRRLVLEDMEKRQISVTCEDIVLLFDREQGATEIAQKYGLKLYAVVPFKSKGLYWLKDRLTKLEYDVITEYLRNEEKYQDKNLQTELKELALKNNAQPTQRPVCIA